MTAGAVGKTVGGGLWANYTASYRLWKALRKGNYEEAAEIATGAGIAVALIVAGAPEAAPEAAEAEAGGAAAATEAETGAATASKPGGAGAAANSGANAVTSFADKTAARQAFGGEMRSAANRFFRDATSKSKDFQVRDLGNGGYRMQFFSTANNPGYGKLYVQEIDSTGSVLKEFKDTMGPDGLIERKWISGGP
jgi:hypothetical protein